LRDGFHATSMQDLLDEAGVSAGGLYRYFASKDEIVLAIAQDNLLAVVAMLDEVAATGAPESIGAALAGVMRLIRARQTQDRVAGLAVLVWGETLRDPALAAEFKKMLRRIHRDLVQAVRSLQAAGSLPDSVDADGLAKVFFSVIPGFLLQTALFGVGYVDDMPAAVEALWPAS
jgi:AcrR family transcriptional regulator